MILFRSDFASCVFVISASPMSSLEDIDKFKAREEIQDKDSISEISICFLVSWSLGSGAPKAIHTFMLDIHVSLPAKQIGTSQ